MLPILATLFGCVAIALWLRERDLRRSFEAKAFVLNARLEDSEEYRELVKQSGLRGNPLVRWTHKSTNAVFLKARFEGETYLFEEEAVRQARQRAVLMMEPTQI